MHSQQRKRKNSSFVVFNSDKSLHWYKSSDSLQKFKFLDFFRLQLNKMSLKFGVLTAGFALLLCLACIYVVQTLEDRALSDDIQISTSGHWFAPRYSALDDTTIKATTNRDHLLYSGLDMLGQMINRPCFSRFYEKESRQRAIPTTPKTHLTKTNVETRVKERKNIDELQYRSMTVVHTSPVESGLAFVCRLMSGHWFTRDDETIKAVTNRDQCLGICEERHRQRMQHKHFKLLDYRFIRLFDVNVNGFNEEENKSEDRKAKLLGKIFKKKKLHPFRSTFTVFENR